VVPLSGVIGAGLVPPELSSVDPNGMPVGPAGPALGTIPSGDVMPSAEPAGIVDSSI
jgi:hypothetical protein